MGELLSRVRSFGIEFTPQQIERTRDLYAPTAPRPTPDVCSVARDVSYGPHARNKLDVFTPAGGATKAPVLVFVHGGGFIQGDKGGPDDPFYNNVGAWACSEGLVAVTMTYRLAPDNVWPAGSRDVAAAVKWIQDNIEGHGGDPDTIVLMGHSAGGAHVAGYISHPDMRDDAREALKGAILVSGVYDMEHSDNSFYAAYYGEDETVYRSQSAVPGLAASELPLMLTVSELDPPDFQRQAVLAVSARVGARGAWPATIWLRGHNHISPLTQIGGPDDTLGPEIARMIAEVR